MYTHPSLQAKRGCAPFWRESWRALRVSQWAVARTPVDELAQAKIRALQEVLTTTTVNLERGLIIEEIAALSHPTTWRGTHTTSKDFDQIRKITPQQERPKLIRDWTGEGHDVTIPLRELINLMKSPLVTSNQRTTTWRVLNRAYRTDEHCGPDYPYKGCMICGAKQAGVTHRYFTCYKSREIWKQIYKKIGITTPLWNHPGKDLFFFKTLPRAPPQVRAILFHQALWQIHLARRAQVIKGQTTTPQLACLGFMALVDKTLERISKFGKLIPGGKRQILGLKKGTSAIFFDFTTGRLAMCWNSSAPSSPGE